MKYITLITTLLKLDDAVNEYLSAGWEPLGGPVYIPRNDSFLQALILRTDKK